MITLTEAYVRGCDSVIKALKDGLSLGLPVSTVVESIESCYGSKAVNNG